MGYHKAIKKNKEDNIMSAKNLTNQNFNLEINGSTNPVLVDFWASWCGPCRALSPIVEQIAEEHPEYLVAKVNIDEEPELAQRFGVMTIPTLIVFEGGQEKRRSVGVRPKQQILELLK